MCDIKKNICAKSVKFITFVIYICPVSFGSVCETGSGRYERYMVLPVLCECINNIENMAVV